MIIGWLMRIIDNKDDFCSCEVPSTASFCIVVSRKCNFIYFLFYNCLKIKSFFSVIDDTVHQWKCVTTEVLFVVSFQLIWFNPFPHCLNTCGRLVSWLNWLSVLFLLFMAHINGNVSPTTVNFSDMLHDSFIVKWILSQVSSLQIPLKRCWNWCFNDK